MSVSKMIGTGWADRKLVVKRSSPRVDGRMGYMVLLFSVEERA
jgi:hypothetical protein